MKFALSALTLLCTAFFASGAEPAPSKAAPKSAPAQACSSCALSPCTCGFSPSYYTQNRKPARRVARKPAPIVRHWTRPSPTLRRPATRPVLSKSVTTSLHVPKVVPTVTPQRRLGYVPARSYRTQSTGCRVTCRPCNVPSRTSSLVPFAGRPRAVPTITPKRSLGYDPSRSWAHGGVVRRTRR